MRQWVIVLLFFLSNISWGQEVYQSSYSLHVPTGIVEYISRIIKVDDKHIQIESEAGYDLIDVQIMVINSRKLIKYDYTHAHVYHCSSEDGLFPSLVIIEENPVFISVIQPSRISGEEEEYRLFIEPDR